MGEAMDDVNEMVGVVVVCSCYVWGGGGGGWCVLLMERVWECAHNILPICNRDLQGS